MEKAEKICPLCGKDNNCQHGQAECWCTKVKIPKHVLNLVPEYKKIKYVYTCNKK